MGKEGGVSLPDCPVPGYIFYLSFWQAGLLLSLTRKKASLTGWGYTFSLSSWQAVSGRLYLGSQKKRLSCCVRGKLFVEDRP